MKAQQGSNGVGQASVLLTEQDVVGVKVVEGGGGAVIDDDLFDAIELELSLLGSGFVLL